MNSSDLLCAIAQADEKYLRESEQFSAITAGIKAERKKRQRFTAIGVAAVFAAVLGVSVFGIVALTSQSFHSLVPPNAVGSQVPDTSAAIPTGPSSEGTTETTPSPTKATSGDSGIVYTDLVVDYDAAKERFAHPIKSCESSRFIHYNAVIVCPNGDIHASGAYCLSVAYVFTNGSVDLRDQNRMTEGITPTGNVYEYQGRTFYVQLPEFNGDQIRVWYFPTGQSGIAYQAGFERQADVNEIMDLIISLEM